MTIMESVRVNIVRGNLRPVLSKLESYIFDKKNESLYLIECSHQALRYGVVYIDENCQTTIIFDNLGI